MNHPDQARLSSKMSQFCNYFPLDFMIIPHSILDT